MSFRSASEASKGVVPGLHHTTIATALASITGSSRMTSGQLIGIDGTG